MNKTFTRTKFICTIGPSSWDPKIMQDMIESGMNCARVNGAFADKDEMLKVTKLVRSISNNVSLMIDTKGPEVRLNKFEKAIPLQVGKTIDIGSTNNSTIYPANYPNIYEKLNVGQIIKVGDGDVSLRIENIQNGIITAMVLEGELLKPAKALNFPGLSFNNEVLTQKDLDLIEYAKEFEWDFVCASFIRNANSAKEVNKALKNTSLKLIAKIEDQQGIDNLDEILPEVYGILVARGGLGVDLGLEKVPEAQDIIVQKCFQAKKTVIVATQFLESMIINPNPTRAEVDGVSNAIEDGADCIMLSGETSAGSYPVKAVEVLRKVSVETEKRIDLSLENNFEFQYHEDLDRDSMIKAAASYCLKLGNEISGVIAISEAGGFARLLGKYNIRQEIIALVKNDSTTKHLTIDKGIAHSLKFINSDNDKDETLNNVRKSIADLGNWNKGDKIFVISDEVSKENFKLPRIFETITL